MAIDGKDDGRKLTSGPGGINEGSSTGELLLRARVRGDAFDRYQLTVGGTEYVGDGTTRPSLSGTFGAVTDGIVYVAGTGDDADDGLSPGKAKATIAAALTAMGTTRRGVIKLGLGTFDVGNGLSLAGYRCVIQGLPGGGSIIHASTQTGAVLDLDGWLYSTNFADNAVFSDFVLLGSGVAGAAKYGLSFDGNNTKFRNISVRSTGGTPLRLDSAALNTFDHVTLNQPVDAAANNVPYMIGTGATNGNTFIALGLRSITTDPEGLSGCVRLEDDGVSTPHENLFMGCWDEFLHLPDNGSVVRFKANANTIADWQTFDSSAVETSSAGNCWFRLGVPAVSDFGGNSIRGKIPGRDTGDNKIAHGVILEQSRNRVEGVRGYANNNVQIASGVQYSYVALGGMVSGTSYASAVDNDSGNATNSIITPDLLVPLFARKTTDEGRTSTVALANDADLVVPVQADSTYVFEATIFYDGATTGDLKFDLTSPAGSTLKWAPVGLTGAATSGAGSIDVRVGVGTPGAAGAGTQTGLRVRGLLRTAGTAGNLQFRWAQVVSDATATTVYIDSFITAEKVA